MPSPSTLHRDMACPPSSRESKKYPKTQTSYAKVGNTSHNLLAMALDEGDTKVVMNHPELNQDQKLVVMTAIGQISKAIPEGAKLEVERFMDFSPFGMELAGDHENEHCADVCFSVMNDEFLHLYIVDFKSGKGPVPEPKDNPQLKAYLLAWVTEIRKKYKGKLVGNIGICQPQLFAKVQWAKVTEEELDAFGAQMESAIELANSDQPYYLADFVPGDHCAFCPAEKFCEAKKLAVTQRKSAKDTKAKEITEMVTVAPVEFDVREALATLLSDGPIMVLDAETVQRANSMLAASLTLKVTDQKSADDCGIFIADATKMENEIEKRRKERKAPILKLEEVFDQKFKEAGIPARTAKNNAKTELNTWLAEKDRIQQEAEEKQRLEEERLERERQKAEEDAANAKTKKGKAEAEQRARDLEEQRLEAERNKPAPPAKHSVAGVKVTPTTTWSVPDIEKVPEKFILKQVNGPLIEAAIKAKQLTAKDKWIVINTQSKSSSK